MPGPTFVLRIEIPGQAPLIRGLSRFAEGINDFSPYWQDYLLPAWYRSVGSHYETQGATTGERWAPLTARYAAWKQKHWPGMPIGVLTGDTKASVTNQSDANAVVTISPKQLTVGTRVPYAMYLQRGTKRMVARPPLRASDMFATQAARLLQEFGVKAAKTAGVAA